MRYVLAIVALAISGIMLLLGIGQRTFLAGPGEIVAAIEFDEELGYAVIDSAEFSKVPGQANVVMRGDAAFAAIAKTRDARGWLAPFEYASVTLDPSTLEVTGTVTRPTKPTSTLLQVDESGYAVPLDPRGNDLWIASRSGADGMFRMPVALKGDQSVVIAGNGVDPIPSGAAIVWVQDRSTPWAGPLLVAGGLFALLGAVLYIIAFDRDKRALGPRRGRRGPLLGVQNVVGARRRSREGTDPIEDTGPRRGGLTSAPALPPGKRAEPAAESARAGRRAREERVDEERTEQTKGDDDA